MEEKIVSNFSQEITFEKLESVFNTFQKYRLLEKFERIKKDSYFEINFNFQDREEHKILIFVAEFGKKSKIILQSRRGLTIDYFKIEILKVLESSP